MGRLLIFDMDGTLVDSEATIVRCMNQASSEFGFKLHSLRENIGVLKLDDILAINGIENDTIRKILNLYKDCYNRTFYIDTRATPGAFDALERLQSNNKIGILTLKYEDLTKKLLTYFFPGIKFSTVICGDSGIKSKVEGLEIIIKEMGFKKSDIYYIGDRGSDMYSAMEAGVNGIWISSGLGKNDIFPENFKFYKLDSFKDLTLIFS